MNRILYIEDMAGEAELIQRLYAMCNKCFHGEVVFETCGNWHSGIEYVRKNSPDVLLLDLVIPPMSADETLEMLSSEPNLPPVFVLTGTPKYGPRESDLRNKSFAAGASDFMLKQDAVHYPEELCERIYHCHLRRVNGSRP